MTRRLGPRAYIHPAPGIGGRWRPAVRCVHPDGRVHRVVDMAPGVQPLPLTAATSVALLWVGAYGDCRQEPHVLTLAAAPDPAGRLP